jgi:energy-coupling factor transport system ATP-binding protein
MDGAPEKVFCEAEALWEAGLDVPQTTELLWRLRDAGLDVPLDVFDPDECAATVKAALEARGCLK